MVIYVGNFPIDTTEEVLRSKFEVFGRVSSVNVMTDSVSGRGLGFGFVEMPGRNQARDAVKALHKSRIGTRTIMVAETPDRVERRSLKKTVASESAS